MDSLMVQWMDKWWLYIVHIFVIAFSKLIVWNYVFTAVQIDKEIHYISKTMSVVLWAAGIFLLCVSEVISNCPPDLGKWVDV